MGCARLIHVLLLPLLAVACATDSSNLTRIVYDASSDARMTGDAAFDGRVPDAALETDARLETDAPLGECEDGIDNDGDGFIDEVDFGCTPNEDGTTDGLTENSCTSDQSCAGDLACNENGLCVEPSTCDEPCPDGQMCNGGMCS